MTMLRALRTAVLAAVNVADAVVHASLAAFSLPSIKSITPNAMVAIIEKTEATIIFAGHGRAHAAPNATDNATQVASALL
jgi:hypothetical protein